MVPEKFCRRCWKLNRHSGICYLDNFPLYHSAVSWLSWFYWRCGTLPCGHCRSKLAWLDSSSTLCGAGHAHSFLFMKSCRGHSSELDWTQQLHWLLWLLCVRRWFKGNRVKLGDWKEDHYCILIAISMTYQLHFKIIKTSHWFLIFVLPLLLFLILWPLRLQCEIETPSS